jgi:hypothetical protein
LRAHTVRSARLPRRVARLTGGLKRAQPCGVVSPIYQHEYATVTEHMIILRYIVLFEHISYLLYIHRFHICYLHQSCSSPVHHGRPAPQPHNLHQIDSTCTPCHISRHLPARIPHTPDSRHRLRARPPRNWHPPSLPQLRLFRPTPRKREEMRMPVKRIDRHACPSGV